MLKWKHGAASYTAAFFRMILSPRIGCLNCLFQTRHRRTNYERYAISVVTIRPESDGIDAETVTSPRRVTKRIGRRRRLIDRIAAYDWFNGPKTAAAA